MQREKRKQYQQQQQQHNHRSYVLIGTEYEIVGLTLNLNWASGVMGNFGMQECKTYNQQVLL